MDIQKRYSDVFEQITESFPSNRRIIPSEIIRSELLYDPERAEVANAFLGKTWKELTVEELRYNDIALSCMTPEAFAYYLPAYMMAILRTPESADILIPGLFYHLRPHGSNNDKLNQIMKKLSSSQRATLRAFISLSREVMPNRVSEEESGRALTYLAQFT